MPKAFLVRRSFPIHKDLNHNTVGDANLKEDDEDFKILPYGNRAHSPNIGENKKNNVYKRRAFIKYGYLAEKPPRLQYKGKYNQYTHTHPFKVDPIRHNISGHNMIGSVSNKRVSDTNYEDFGNLIRDNINSSDIKKHESNIYYGGCSNLIRNNNNDENRDNINSSDIKKRESNIYYEGCSNLIRNNNNDENHCNSSFHEEDTSNTSFEDENKCFNFSSSLSSSSCSPLPLPKNYYQSKIGITKTGYLSTELDYLSPKSDFLPRPMLSSSVSQKPFVCPICGKSFRLSSTLCRHKIIHTADRPHQCYVCSKSFNRSSTLKTHLRTHNQSKEFMCRTCGKGFHQKGNLRNHILIHTGEKPYSCEVCKKAFNKLSNLKFHMHIHTDQKPYRCRFCKVSMGRRGELKLHIRTFHQ